MWLPLIGLVVSFILTGGSGRETRLLAELPESLDDLPWRVVDDDVMGGRSSGALQPLPDAIAFAGRTITRGGGFSSIRSDTRRFDLEGFEGIRLRVRGDGRRYTFRLTTWTTREGDVRPSYWAEFPTDGQGWEVVDIPFERFRPRWRGQWLSGPPLDPAAVDSLGIMIYDGEDGPFRLEVDWIGAFRRSGREDI